MPDKLALSNERTAAAPCITSLQRTSCDQDGTATCRARPFGMDLFGMEESTATGCTEDSGDAWAREYGRGLRLLYRADEDLPSEMQALVDELAKLEDR